MEPRFEPIGEVEPFELHRGFVIAVKGTIGELSDLTFIIDTGSLPTVVDSRVARKLSLRGNPVELETFAGKEAAEEIQLPSLRAGIFRAGSTRALTADLSRLDARFGGAADAIVGAEFLSGRAFAIDYIGRTLRPGRQGGAWPSTVRLTRRSPFPVADVTIDGVRLRLKIDTGSEAIAVFESAAPPAWKARVDTDVEANALSGGLRLGQVTSHTLALGPDRWRDVPLFIVPYPAPSLTYDGVLGPRALGISHLYLDLERMEFAYRASRGW